MKQKLNIYDLNNSSYLYEDIENVINRIGDLYEMQFFKDKVSFISKIKFPKSASWVSDQTSKIFNELIPIFKSIIKDIYSIIEGVFVYKKGKFDKPLVEKKYKHLSILREFNNKLKHHNNKKVIFNLTSVINIHPQTIDCWIQYKYESEDKICSVPLVEFFHVFFMILEDEDIITLERK